MDLILRGLVLPMVFVLVLIAFFFGVPYPVLPLTGLLIIYTLAGGAALWLVEREWRPARDLFFIMFCLDCLLAAFALYYTGGIESFIPQVLMIIAVLAGLLLPLWQVVALVAACYLVYIGELWLEASRLVPHLTIFKPFIDPAAYAGSVYFKVIPLANLLNLAATAALAYLAARVLETRERKVGLLNRRLENNAEQLRKKGEEKTALNEQLSLKVQELEGLKIKLEEMVADRTRELQVKIGEMTRAEGQLKSNLAELEKINNLAVGRELSMIELEEEANQLLLELGRPVKY
jgi:hypothetical protein